jgi:precorrin-3B synthase
VTIATRAAFVSGVIRNIRAMSTPAVRRADADACPGALRLHPAADGPLARVRLPGGLLSGVQLRVLRELAEAFGDGHLELTSRANLQVRALTAAPAEVLAARLGAAGLLPSPTHELVRNIAASPLHGGVATRRLVEALDRALCADARLAGLPGRFLFALDSGRLDVAPGADVAALPAGSLAGGGAGRDRSGDVAILFAGVDAGLRVPAADVVTALLAAAHAFLDERAVRALLEQRATQAVPGEQTTQAVPDERTTQAVLDNPVTPAGADDGDRPTGAGDGGARPGTDPGPAGAHRADCGPVAWRLRELADGPARVAARTAATLGLRLSPEGPVPAPEPREPVGVLDHPGALLSVGAVVPLGRLDGVQMKVLEQAEAIVVTPWRGVVLPGLPPSAVASWLRALAAAGLEVDTASRWAGVTACAGRPGCAKALGDVRRDATAATLGPAAPAALLPVHWVGCARGCGSPPGTHVRVEATGSGYEVRSPGLSGPATTDEVGALVAAARRS